MPGLTDIDQNESPFQCRVDTGIFERKLIALLNMETIIRVTKVNKSLAYLNSKKMLSDIIIHDSLSEVVKYSAFIFIN